VTRPPNEGERLVTEGLAFQVAEGGVDRIPDFDPRTGDHFWFMPVGYRVADPRRFYDPDPADGPPLLDQESICLVSGIGCYYCEEMWSPRLERRRCPGEPK
jgi:hypothetical protein